jgi:glycosyltransferase involved in cell wall biosynthesis
MPATLVESAFCGIPVVATPVGAIGDVVVDGDTGLIVPVDDVDALTGAIGRLLDDPVEARAISVRARLRSLRSFEISAVAEQWERVLDERARRARR